MIYFILNKNRRFVNRDEREKDTVKKYDFASFSFVFAETLKFFCFNLSPMEFYTLASKYRRLNLP